MKENYLAVGAAVTTLSQDLGRAPTVTELAEHLGLTRDLVSEAIGAGAAQRPTSLDRDPDVGDVLTDVLGSEDPDMGRVEIAALARDLVRDLPERERTIIALRFVHEKTQAEIGQILCTSQMHVSRLLAQTLAELHDEAERRAVADPEHGLSALVSS